jgi:hypothetical protein
MTEHPPARKDFIRAASRGVVAGKQVSAGAWGDHSLPAAGVRLADGALEIRGICDPAASGTDALSRWEVRVCLPAPRLEP